MEWIGIINKKAHYWRFNRNPKNIKTLNIENQSGGFDYKDYLNKIKIYDQLQPVKDLFW